MGTGRSAVAALLLVAQFGLAACASVGGPRSVSKRDLVSIAFAEPEAVPTTSGREIRLHSLVGEVERVAGDTIFLRIADATAVSGEPVEPLLGRRIHVLRADASRLMLLDEDTSGVTMATTLFAMLAALAAGSYLAFGIASSGGS
jgi:hypothetical protein